MGNASGRLNVTRKSNGKQVTAVPEKVVEAHSETTERKCETEVVGKENMEPVVTKLDGDHEVKEHSANGHPTNGHVTTEGDSQPTTEAVQTTSTVVVATETTETTAAHPAVEEASAAHNASTTSETKRSNPLKWLKKNISFKKDKKSKKKDTSAVEEHLEDATNDKPLEEPQQTPAEGEAVTSDAAVVEASVQLAAMTVTETSPETKEEEPTTATLTAVELVTIPVVVEETHHDASLVEPTKPTVEEEHVEHVEINGHPETVPEESHVSHVEVAEPVTETVPTSTNEVATEPQPEVICIKEDVVESSEVPAAVVCNGD